jgi:hypothetical protein
LEHCVGQPRRIHVDDGHRAVLRFVKVFRLERVAGSIVEVAFVRINIEEHMNCSDQFIAAPRTTIDAIALIALQHHQRGLFAHGQRSKGKARQQQGRIEQGDHFFHRVSFGVGCGLRLDKGNPKLKFYKEIK